MGFLRYILEGAGWEIGRQAAREGLDAVGDAVDEAHQRSWADADTAVGSPHGRRTRDSQPVVDTAELERRRERQRRVDAKRQSAEIERQLRELKARAGRS